jgi:uncharacterized protein (DUF58 family)
MTDNDFSQLDPKLIQEIRRLSFITKKLASTSIMGVYKSAYRGQGIEFEEVREYQPGDEIRSIDWKVTARTGAPFVKSYREERELTVMIAVDISASTLTGTKGQLRSSLIAQVGAVLTFIALHNRDKVGLVTFAEDIKSYFPPKRSRSSVWRILHEVLGAKRDHEGTDIKNLCSFLSGVMKRHSVIFIISDFKSPSFEKELSILNKRHDVTAIRIMDACDHQLSGSGIIRAVDPESGETFLIDLSNSGTREKFASLARTANRDLRSMFRQRKVDLLELSSDQSFIDPLRNFFLAKQNSKTRINYS